MENHQSKTNVKKWQDVEKSKEQGKGQDQGDKTKGYYVQNNNSNIFIIKHQIKQKIKLSFYELMQFICFNKNYKIIQFTESTRTPSDQFCK